MKITKITKITNDEEMLLTATHWMLSVWVSELSQMQTFAGKRGTLTVQAIRFALLTKRAG